MPDVESVSIPDITAARLHAQPALLTAAAEACPPWRPGGYIAAGIGIWSRSAAPRPLREGGPTQLSRRSFSAATLGLVAVSVGLPIHTASPVSVDPARPAARRDRGGLVLTR